MRGVPAGGDEARQVGRRDRCGAVVFERVIIERVMLEHSLVEHHDDPLRRVVGQGERA